MRFSVMPVYTRNSALQNRNIDEEKTNTRTGDYD